MMGISSTGTQGCVYLTKPWEKKLSGIPFFANFAITMSRRHYRLDFIAENTFNRVWSLRMSRPRVFLAAGACIAAVAALIFVLLAYTPLRQLMPGALHGDLRSRYIETALRVDSLENMVRIHRAYIDNIATIMRGDDTDTLAYSDGMAAIELPSDADSLLAAGEAERDFVRRYSDEERFNLSVLAPIAAEGMVFGSPLSGGATVDAVPGGIRMNPGRAAAVTAVYRGTITGVFHLAGGGSSIVVQHPNDFLSIYSGLGQVFVEPGQRIEAGQRIAHTSARRPMVFELWHNGSALDPREYIVL